MDIVNRAKNIILSPKTEWSTIKGESITISDMFTQYAVILAAIPAIAGFIGYSIVGFSGFVGGYFRISVSKGFMIALMAYIFALVGVYILGLVIDWLAPTFGAQKDSSSSFKVAIFSMTASWVGGIFSIIPMFGVLTMLAGLYSLYLLYLGIKEIKNPPKEKLIGYFIASLITAIVIYMLINIILGSMMFGAAGLGSYKMTI